MYGVGEKRQRGGRKKKKKKHPEHFETDWDELYDPTRPTNVEEYLRSDEKVDEVREWKALLYRHRKKRDESDISDVDDDDDEDSPPPPPPPPAIITRAPIRYTQPEQPLRDENDHDDDDDNDDDEAYSPLPTLGASGAADDIDIDESQPAPRSIRPGQAGFAHRLMSKYGWTKGTALGANESGILNPLRVQVEKRRRKADAEGGGWAEPGGKGKIVGGKRKEAAGSFGAMSEVIVLQNMLEDMPDLQAEIADGLGQEIGEECGEKAVNELDGRVFNGNKIAPRFYDSEDFETGNYSTMH
ncbi:DNA-damage-repair/toleration protein [Escovopsis weberi]|uniref:DNA-damage-repair/toleration protein n=1 Tax=Escovopsis weberi TaxID=150374 RepID=A0A0M8N649_ESCWE|nr:DNA-damage-repair/toleration protein [Escovopsis weberi]